MRSRAAVTPRWLRAPAKALAVPVHFVMQRRQLLGVRRRVERAAAGEATPDEPTT